MNLNKFDTKRLSNAGAVMQLRNPNDNSSLVDEKTNQPITITLLGRDSDQYTDAIRRISNDRLEESVNVGVRMKMSAQRLEEDGIATLAAATTGWSNIQIDDKPLEFTLANVKKLYAEYPWIREQVEAFVNNRSNFMGNS